MKPLKTPSATFPVPEWTPPISFPDLSDAKEIAIDLETCDPNMELYGPGWPRGDGFVVGYAVAVEGWSGYFPVRHEAGGNLDRGIVELEPVHGSEIVGGLPGVRHVHPFRSGVRIPRVTQHL